MAPSQWSRVVVIGNGGSGKTTLARGLAARLALPVVHLDFHYWHGNEPLEAAAWEREHEHLIAEERWILDGMKLGTLAARLERADAVVFLDLPRRACLGGLLRRRLRYRGRLDHERGVADRLNREFLRYVWSFPRRHRPRVLAVLAEADNVEQHVLTSRRQARAFLASLPGPLSRPQPDASAPAKRRAG